MLAAVVAAAAAAAVEPGSWAVAAAATVVAAGESDMSRAHCADDHCDTRWRGRYGGPANVCYSEEREEREKRTGDNKQYSVTDTGDDTCS